MTQFYTLVERSGSNVIPAGIQYEIVQLDGGYPAIIRERHGDGAYKTSPIVSYKKFVTARYSTLEIQTANSTYKFEGVK